MELIQLQRKTSILRDAVRSINAQIISFELFRKESPRLDILLQNVTEILQNHQLKQDDFSKDEIKVTTTPSTSSAVPTVRIETQQNSERNGNMTGSELLDTYRQAVQEINLQILAFDIFCKDCISLELFIKILQSIIVKGHASTTVVNGGKFDIETSDIGINTDRLHGELYPNPIAHRSSTSSASTISVVSPSSTLLSPPYCPVPGQGPGPGPGLDQRSVTTTRSPEMLHGVFHTSVVQPSETEIAQSNLVTESVVAEPDNGNDHSERENSSSNFNLPPSGSGMGPEPLPSRDHPPLNSTTSRNEADSEEDLPLKKRKVSVSVSATSHFDSAGAGACAGTGNGHASASEKASTSRHHSSNHHLHADVGANASGRVRNIHHSHLSQNSQHPLSPSPPVKQEPDGESLGSRRRKFAFNLLFEPQLPQLPFREDLQQVESTIEELISSSTGGATSSSSVTSKDFIKVYCQAIHVGSFQIDMDATLRPEDTREQFHTCQKMFTVYMCDYGVMFSLPQVNTKELVKLILPNNSVLSVNVKGHHEPHFSIYFRTGNKLARWIRDKLGMTQENPNPNQNHTHRRGKSLSEMTVPWFNPYSDDHSERSVIFVLRHLACEQKEAMRRIFRDKLQFEA